MTLARGTKQRKAGVSTSHIVPAIDCAMLHIVHRSGRGGDVCTNIVSGGNIPSQAALWRRRNACLVFRRWKYNFCSVKMTFKKSTVSGYSSIVVLCWDYLNIVAIVVPTDWTDVDFRSVHIKKISTKRHTSLHSCPLSDCLVCCRCCVVVNACRWRS